MIVIDIPIHLTQQEENAINHQSLYYLHNTSILYRLVAIKKQIQNGLIRLFDSIVKIFDKLSVSIDYM